MACDMCGKDADNMFSAKIEGTQMMVCSNCSRFASEKRRVVAPTPEKKRFVPERGEIVQIITQNYASLIKQGREKLGLKQDEVAKRLAEKVSVIHSLESGKHKPSIALARKLEKFLHIKLVEQHEEKRMQMKTSSSGPMTLGDLLNR